MLIPHTHGHPPSQEEKANVLENVAVEDRASVVLARGKRYRMFSYFGWTEIVLVALHPIGKVKDRCVEETEI